MPLTIITANARLHPCSTLFSSQKSFSFFILDTLSISSHVPSISFHDSPPTAQGTIIHHLSGAAVFAHITYFDFFLPSSQGVSLTNETCSHRICHQQDVCHVKLALCGLGTDHQSWPEYFSCMLSSTSFVTDLWTLCLARFCDPWTYSGCLINVRCWSQ